MSFFNTETANFLQHVAVPLEATGLALTLIEVFWTDMARAAEQRLQRFVDAPVKSMWSLIHVHIAGGPYGYVTAGMVVHGLVASAAGIWVGRVEESWAFGFIAFFAIGFFLYLVEFVLLVGAAYLIRPFSVFTGGRALGGFGIGLGAVGLLMEIYQVISIHVAK